MPSIYRYHTCPCCGKAYSRNVITGRETIINSKLYYGCEKWPKAPCKPCNVSLVKMEENFGTRFEKGRGLYE